MLHLATGIMAKSESFIDVRGFVFAVGAIAAAVVVFGAALGIGKIASSAVEAIGRQPEAGGRIFTAMVIAASLIEGVALFAILAAIITFFTI